MTTIASNIAKIISQIRCCSIASGRDGEAVRLLCVSKTHAAELVCEAYAAGQRCFGESYVNEAIPKIEALRGQGLRDIEWHFIGPLQTNKIKAIANHFDIVESVDRDKAARLLSARRNPQLGPLGVLIQVNISHEPQKSGIAAAQLTALAELIAALPNLQLRGLMGIARAGAEDHELCATFKQLRMLFEELQRGHPGCDLLSMGMTQDMEQAISCGSTQVRIGTAIFGARQGRT